MVRSPGEPSVQIVLNAFDTLFNKRDYDAAERFWSPRYIQHSAHIPPGREGLFSLVKTLPDTLRAISFSSMDVSPVSPCPWCGSSLTSSAWRTVCSPSTGMSSRTRPHGSSRSVVRPCLATTSHLDHTFKPDRALARNTRTNLGDGGDYPRCTNA